MRLCMGCMEEISDNENPCPYCGFVQGTMPEQGNQMPPETILHGKYILGKVIGYGGFGVTYLAYDAELNMKVAIKEYMPNEFSGRVQGETKVTVFDGDKTEQFHTGLSKFKDEAKRLAKFENVPGIVKIFDSFEENGTGYLVMEYIDGETLKEKLKREKKLSLKESLGIILPILSSLKEIHKTGLIHRDIAPDNIMVSKDGEAKLIDFGASRFATATHSRSLTVLMKQGYAPTEQYNSRGDQGPWTDVYALAATFNKMLTGITPEDAMERKAHDELKPPSKAGADCGKNVDAAIMNALNLGIEYRTKDMEQFEKELLSDTEVTRIVEPDHKADVGKMPRWMKAVIGTAAVVLAGVVGTAGWYAANNIASTGSFRLKDGMTQVPNFRNSDYKSAEALAERNMVKIQIGTPVYDEEIAENTVCRQDIAVGQQVIQWDMVSLSVSMGKKLVEVPSFYAMSKEEAVELILLLNLEYEIEEVENAAVAGTVIQQEIQEHEMVESGTVIKLQVSKGPAIPEPGSEAGKVIIFEEPAGMTEEKLQKLLGGLGLAYQPHEQFDDTVEKGIVISADVKAEDEVTIGTVVNYYVSKGKETFTIPQEIRKGITQAEAVRLLSEKGLTANIRKEADENVPNGSVISIDPAANSVVYKDTPISLVVSTGPFETKMPNLTASKSVTKEQAIETLEKQGFIVNVAEEESDLPAGIVIAQSIKADEMVKVNSTVTITVSKGKETPSSGTKTATWSDWVSLLPAGVNENSYDIEIRYAYKDAQSTYTDWSEWSNWQDGNASQDTDTMQYESQTVYRARSISTTSTPSYGDWSTWSGWQDGNALSNTDTAQYESRTVYRTRTINTTSTPSYGDWSGWSSWQDGAAPASTDTTQYESQTLYRTRTKETTTSSASSLEGWTRVGNPVRNESAGNWSDWTESVLTATENGNGRTEVKTESRTRQVQIGTEYHYYRYYMTNHPSWWNTYSYDVAKNYNYTYYDTWISENKGTEFEVSNEEHWWACPEKWQSGQQPESRAVYSDQNYTVYSSRYITYGYTYNYEKWSGWSEWTTTPATANAATEVETKAQYRSRTRSVSNTTSTSLGNWSDWTTTPATTNATMQAESKAQYRSRTRSVSNTTSTSYGNWSDWTSTPASANATTQVETKPQYRSRTRSMVQNWPSNWSWSSTPVSASDTRQVGEIQYRYKNK